MKIVKEFINEIRQNVKGSGLSALGIGSEGIKHKINKWFNDFYKIYNERINYKIDNNLNVVLSNQEQYIMIFDKLPPFIKIKFRPTPTIFIISTDINDNELMNNELVDYDKLNIEIPPKFKKFIEDLKKLNYVCVSSRSQFSHSILTFIDLNKNKVIGVYFYEINNNVMIRRYDVLKFPYFRISPKIIKNLYDTNINNYQPIIDYLLKYRLRK